MFFLKHGVDEQQKQLQSSTMICSERRLPDHSTINTTRHAIDVIVSHKPNNGKCSSQQIIALKILIQCAAPYASHLHDYFCVVDPSMTEWL